MSELILVGTAHGELSGPQRLRRILSYLDPHVLTVEASNESLALFKENLEGDYRALVEVIRRSAPNFARIIESIPRTDGYEYDICQEYAAKNRIPLYLVDDPSQAQAMREYLLQFLSLFTQVPGWLIDTWTEATIRRGHELMYELCQRSIDGQLDSLTREQFLGPNRGKVIGQRDAYMEGQLRKVLKEHSGERIVHVGGGFHVMHDPMRMTLFERVADLKPVRITLNQADSLPAQNAQLSAKDEP